MNAIAPLLALLPLLLGWVLDKCFGDPLWLPHPIVAFGKAIAWGEHRLNKGRHRKAKGALWAVLLIVGTYLFFHYLFMALQWIGGIPLWTVGTAVMIFFCLAGTTLAREVRMVFEATDRSIEEGRRQVARIVGRDTAQLSPQEVRTAALETLAENLSDGVIAPLFWYMLLGVEGMLMYKMINTLDSMIGYHSERYLQFGCVAARIDDVANYIPARLTAALMVIVSGKLSCFAFVKRYGRAHASPNSGYPESALAGILDCRFGGPHNYFGQRFDKPYIGSNPRTLNSHDMQVAVRINQWSELLMVAIVSIFVSF